MAPREAACKARLARLPLDLTGRGTQTGASSAGCIPCRFSFCPSPTIDPVLVSIGPFAIRWYALAYIVGILLGWVYARAIIRNERLWGGPAPLTVSDFDDFIVWVTHRHHSRRPHRLCAVLQSRLFRREPAADLPVVERRHVVPRRLSRLRRGGGPVRLAAQHLRSSRSATSPARSARSGCFSAGSRISSTANCGAARRTCPGRWCFPEPDRCRAIRASSMRRRSRASCC